MVYSQKFVACVLVNGEPQRELANGTVPIPFGTEYALRFRNKHDRRAVVQIFIDGENVSGGGYVIQPRSSVDIRRHADKDVAFKFVSLDSPEAVDHGKNGPNTDKIKGTIEARFFLEKKDAPTPKIVEHHHHHYPKPWGSWRPWYYDTALWQYAPPYGTWCGTGGASSSGGSATSTFAAFNKGDQPISGVYCASAISRDLHEGTPTMDAAPAAAPSMPSMPTIKLMSLQKDLKDGCTVEGNYTGQTFWETHVDLETEYTSVKMFLQGYDASTSKRSILLCEDKPKGKSLLDLERENEDLRRKLAEIERKELEAQLERKKKAKPKIKKV